MADKKKGVESPYYQPKNTGIPAENKPERSARADYNKEKSDTGRVNWDKPGWAMNLGPKKK